MALQHNIGYIAPVNVVNVRMSTHTGLVGSYHLAPSNSGWILLPYPTGGGAEFDGDKPFYTLGQWAYYILPLTHRRNARPYDIIFNRQIAPVSMQYKCLCVRVSRFALLDKYCNAIEISFFNDDWLFGFYGTAALYRLFNVGECSECKNECASRVGGVVTPCTLE